MRLSRMRNEQELSGAQREIDATKESNSRLEEELLTRPRADARPSTEACAKRRPSSRSSRDESPSTSAHVSTRASGSSAPRSDRTSDEREAIAGRLNVTIRKKYEQIFARRGGLAVVEIRRGSARAAT